MQIQMRKDHIETSTKLYQDGEWRLITRYNEYLILHYCSNAVFSWDRHRHKKDWAWVGKYGLCVACEAAPPNEMIGMKALCEWER